MLKNKVVLITGSSTNIGRATAILFAKKGAKVVVNCKTNIEGAREVVREIKQNGGNAIVIQADVSEPEEVKRLFSETIKAFNTLDILINNAGYTDAVPFLESTKEQWLKQFNDNFFGTVLCSQEAAKLMLKKHEGKIINTASIRGLGHTGREGIMPYSAAKAAVINFTRTLAKLLAPHINVNAVAPGVVDTPHYNTIPEGMKKGFIESTLIKRSIKVEEIAEAFLYLATADAITGQVLIVDGGYAASGK